MKFHNRHKRNIKRYPKIIGCEYAILFDNSNSLIEFICTVKTTNIIKSSLYTKNDDYQLLILSNHASNFIAVKNVIFKDKLHIDEIKSKSHLICKDNAVQKMQKAFRAT